MEKILLLLLSSQMSEKERMMWTFMLPTMSLEEREKLTSLLEEEAHSIHAEKIANLKKQSV